LPEFNAYYLIEADNGIIDFDRSLRDLQDEFCDRVSPEPRQL